MTDPSATSGRVWADPAAPSPDTVPFATYRADQDRHRQFARAIDRIRYGAWTAVGLAAAFVAGMFFNACTVGSF